MDNCMNCKQEFPPLNMYYLSDPHIVLDYNIQQIIIELIKKYKRLSLCQGCYQFITKTDTENLSLASTRKILRELTGETE